MVQWTNLQRTKKFVNSMKLYRTCEKSGGLHVAEPGLMAGRQAGRLADKIWVRFEILKVDFPLRLSKALHCFSNDNDHGNDNDNGIYQMYTPMVFFDLRCYSGIS